MAGFEPIVILKSDSPETVCELIHAGIGISFIPHVTWNGMLTENITLARFPSLNVSDILIFFGEKQATSLRLHGCSVIFQNYFKTRSCNILPKSPLFENSELLARTENQFVLIGLPLEIYFEVTVFQVLI